MEFWQEITLWAGLGGAANLWGAWLAFRNGHFRWGLAMLLIGSAAAFVFFFGMGEIGVV